MAKQISCQVIDGKGLVITGDDGSTIELNLSDLDASIIDAAALHGLKQKVCDAGAIGRNPDTGATATTADKMAAMRKVADRLRGGEWNAERGGGGTGGAGLLVRALCRLQPGKPEAEIRAWVQALDKKAQDALRASKKVAPVIAKLQAEDAKKRAATAGVDADSLLADLGI